MEIAVFLQAEEGLAQRHSEGGGGGGGNGGSRV